MAPRAAAAAAATEPAEIFAYEARKDGRPVVVLRGFESGTDVTVEADVYPVNGAAEQEGMRRPFPFTSREQAMRFVEETLTALQYLDCVVVE